MRTNYTEEEKEQYVELFKNSGETITNFCKEYELPCSTLRGWLKTDEDQIFGAVSIGQKVPPKKTIISFSTDTIKIELKENFDKDMFRKVIEVLIND